MTGAEQHLFWVIPTAHPAFVLRDKLEWANVISHDLARAFRIAETGWSYNPKIRIGLPRKSVPYDEALQLVFSYLARLDLRVEAQPIAIDTETTGLDQYKCGLRAVSLSQVGTLEACSFAYSKAVWGGSGLARIGAALARVLASPAPKLMHNVLYDHPVLTRHGFVINGRFIDTQVAHHNVESSLPHDLGFIAARWHDVDPWKVEFGAQQNRSNKSWKNADWLTLLYYCLHEQTPILLADGTTRLLGDIVRHRETVSVLSLGPNGIEAKPVVGWHQNRVKAQKWIRIRAKIGARAYVKGLTLTPDHCIFTRRGKIRADEARRGDEIATAEIAFTSAQRSAILGTLLGDARLVLSPMHRDSPSKATGAALDCVHTEASLLCRRKVAFLQPHARLGYFTPSRRKRFPGGHTRTCKSLRHFSTPMLTQLRQLANRVYDRTWRRRIKPATLDELGPVGLAWWFMDDGFRQTGGRLKQCNGSRGGRLYSKESVGIATQGFPHKDVLVALRWFRRKFGATSVGADWVLRLSTRATEAFCAYIAPHVFPAQRYKLPRNRTWPAYVRAVPAPTEPVYAEITCAGSYSPPRSTRTQRLRAETRFCLTVEGNHNFFTSFGLVANCARDSLETARLWPTLYEALRTHSPNALELFWFHMWEIDLALRMGRTGLPIHEETRKTISAQLHTRRDDAVSEIRASTNWPEFNPRRKKDQRELLYERLKLPVRKYTLKRKEPSTSYKAIVEHAGIPAVRAFITYEEVKSLLSNVVDKYARLPDRRLHVVWNTTGTDGSRMSTSPNLQNWMLFPINVRNIVQAPPGRTFVHSDYDQLELRIQAGFAGAKHLLGVFARGEDPHGEMAGEVFGSRFRTAEPVTRKALRTLTKRVVYGMGYGGGTHTIYRVLMEDKRIDLETRSLLREREVGRIKDTFLKINPEILVWRERILDQVNTHSFLTIPPFGRTRRFLATPVPGPKAFNWPIQVCGHDFLLLAMWKIDNGLPPSAQILTDEHDGLLVECDEQDADSVKALVESSMYAVLNGPGGPVALTATTKVGPIWGEL